MFTNRVLFFGVMLMGYAIYLNWIRMGMCRLVKNLAHGMEEIMFGKSCLLSGKTGGGLGCLWMSRNTLKAKFQWFV